ncbi:HD-GYP domain-containing protein [Bacterioplanoides pacificum]|uniref:HD-GYP domain-containing protein n=1 Tax=Bacterioplanoides pacificum TaxID=1171596 RepID=A0ABV7VYD9_9GAMM
MEKERILLVDDEAFYIKVLVELLGSDYQITLAKSGAQALKLLEGEILPDLILLDVLMPGMDGYEICQAIKADARTRDIPVIFLTVKSEVEDEVKGFRCGASDYIVKPFSPPIVKARVATHLALQQSRKALRNSNAQLEQRVQQRTREISRTQDMAIYCMTSLAETRDNETGMHIRRTQHYVRVLAEHLHSHARFSDQLNDEFIELLFKSAPLHDIGKVGVPDRILLKPGKLNPEEWQEMQKHAQYGKEALDNAEREYGASSFLSMAKDIAYCHHERWDGKGYPQALSGDDIPLAARLMALADCYDALISKRVYKPAFSFDDAADIIVKGRGTQFDPDMVDAFVALEAVFVDIARRFADEE